MECTRTTDVEFPVKDPMKWTLTPEQIQTARQNNEVLDDKETRAWYWHCGLDVVSDTISEMAPFNFGKLCWSLSTSNIHTRTSVDQYAVFGNYGYSLARMSKAFYKSGTYYYELVPFIPTKFNSKTLVDEANEKFKIVESAFNLHGIKENQALSYENGDEKKKASNSRSSNSNNQRTTYADKLPSLYQQLVDDFDRSVISYRQDHKNYKPYKEDSLIAPSSLQEHVIALGGIRRTITKHLNEIKNTPDFLRIYPALEKDIVFGNIETKSIKTGYEPAWRLGLTTIDAYINSYPGSDGQGFSIRSVDLSFVNAGTRTNPTTNSFGDGDVISFKVFLKDDPNRECLPSVCLTKNSESTSENKMLGDEDEIEVDASDVLAYEIAVDEEPEEHESYVEIYKNGRIIKKIVISSQASWFISAGCFGGSGVYANVGQLHFKYPNLAENAYPAQKIFNDNFETNYLL